MVVDAELRLAVVAGLPPSGAFADAERLLRDIAALEERRVDDADPSHPADPALRRLEAKLDLALQLLALALPQLSGPPPQAVRIGPHGVRVAADGTLGAQAVLRWQPADALPMGLQLPVRRMGRDGGMDFWAFEGLPPSLEDALSRHLFRLHRRALAAQRRT